MISVPDRPLARRVRSIEDDRPRTGERKNVWGERTSVTHGRTRAITDRKARSPAAIKISMDCTIAIGEHANASGGGAHAFGMRNCATANLNNTSAERANTI